MSSMWTETGVKRDGEQAWIWTFMTDEHTLYAVRESRENGRL